LSVRSSTFSIFRRSSEELGGGGGGGGSGSGSGITHHEEKLAQNAEKHAYIVAKNISKLYNNLKLIPYKSKQRVMVISLGPKKSLLVRGGIMVEGRVISKIKSLVEVKKVRNFQSK